MVGMVGIHIYRGQQPNWFTLVVVLVVVLTRQIGVMVALS
jgi:hypothetical protein